MARRFKGFLLYCKIQCFQPIKAESLKNMNKIDEKKLVIAGLTITGIVFVILAFFTPLAEGGADNYAHFNIARWAFRYPHLFLDHWGKPVYTIVAAPFAQFGFAAVRILNSVLGLLTGWFIWKLAGKLKLENGWFATVVAVFTPIYFALMSTGMTEIIFSLILVLAVYLFFSEKYYASAILISFLFLARTEGLAFELLFLIALIIKKQYKPIPFLATGFIVFSLIGLVFHYHDFWWLYNQRPYSTGNQFVYGKGDWYYFLVRIPEYSGVFVTVLLVAGTIILPVKWMKEKFSLTGNYFLPILLILGTFWGYFFIHSYLWWKGETSAGLLRVMAGNAPLAGIIGLYAVQPASNYLKKNRFLWAELALLSVAIIVFTGVYYKKLIGFDLTAEVLQRTTNWLKESGSLNHKLVMHNPYFSFATEIDAWDNKVVQYGFSNNDAPETDLPDSTVFIWDAHFSPNEGKLPLEKIMSNPNFVLIQYFEPKTPFKVMGDNDYRIMVFRKIANAGLNNYEILEHLKRIQIEKGIYYSEIYDCEKPFQAEYLEKQRILSQVDTANHLFELNGVDFSPAFHVPVEQTDRIKENIFHLSADFMRTDSVGVNRLLMVFSVEAGGKAIHYVTADIGEQTPEKNVWYKTHFTFYVPGKLEDGTMLKSYIWNIDKKAVLMDNYKLEISKQAKE